MELSTDQSGEAAVDLQINTLTATSEYGKDVRTYYQAVQATHTKVNGDIDEYLRAVDLHASWTSSGKRSLYDDERHFITATGEENAGPGSPTHRFCFLQIEAEESRSRPIVTGSNLQRYQAFLARESNAKYFGLDVDSFESPLDDFDERGHDPLRLQKLAKAMYKLGTLAGNATLTRHFMNEVAVPIGKLELYDIAGRNMNSVTSQLALDRLQSLGDELEARPVLLTWHKILQARYQPEQFDITSMAADVLTLLGDARYWSADVYYRGINFQCDRRKYTDAEEKYRQHPSLLLLELARTMIGHGLFDAGRDLVTRDTSDIRVVVSDNELQIGELVENEIMLERAQRGQLGRKDIRQLRALASQTNGYDYRWAPGVTLLSLVLAGHDKKIRSRGMTARESFIHGTLGGMIRHQLTSFGGNYTALAEITKQQFPELTGPAQTDPYLQVVDLARAGDEALARTAYNELLLNERLPNLRKLEAAIVMATSFGFSNEQIDAVAMLDSQLDVLAAQLNHTSAQALSFVERSSAYQRFIGQLKVLEEQAQSLLDLDYRRIMLERIARIKDSVSNL